ncbi:MAG: hypothetical protein KTR31_32065 [Myxococcales bacterium]|nr:hypothetical protein [Myxococcales bacterium]
MMKRLWRAMATEWPIGGPRPLVVDRLGVHTVRYADDLGWWVRRPLVVGDPYPSQGCEHGRVVTGTSPADVWAICTGSPPCCDATPLSTTQVVELDVHQLVVRLRRSLGVRGAHSVPRWDAIALLGIRTFGSRTVSFALIPRPSALPQGAIEDWIAARPGMAHVFVTPSRDELPSRLTPRPGVAWLCLEDTWRPIYTEGPCPPPAAEMDLSDLVLFGLIPMESGFEALLWPRFALVLAGERTVYAGRALPLRRRPRMSRLLGALAARPSEWVCRRDLLLHVFDDEITSTGRYLTEPTRLERRLRQLVSGLSALLRSTEPGTDSDLPDRPIQNLRSRSDLEGGYRLALPSPQVLVVDPPSAGLGSRYA